MENKKKGNFKVFLKKTLKRGAIIIGYVIALNVAQQIHSFAADDPIAIVNTLSNFIFILLIYLFFFNFYPPVIIFKIAFANVITTPPAKVIIPFALCVGS